MNFGSGNPSKLPDRLFAVTTVMIVGRAAAPELCDMFSNEPSGCCLSFPVVDSLLNAHMSIRLY